MSENELGSLIPNLPAFLPIVITAAIATRLDSQGPVLFFQERVGFRGRPFRIEKFRTMRADAEEGASAYRRQDALAMENDERITRVGSWMRKIRIDELPQIWNVLKGEMSWIGPRPEAASLSNWYEGEIPFYSYRHNVRPRITGRAQVNQGHVTELDVADTKLRYDFYCVNNLSVWLDALIVLKTIPVVLNASGAR